VVITQVIAAIISLLQHCTLPDGADFVQHTYYKTVRFVPEYPLFGVDVPVVALSLAGGTNQGKGLGQWERWHRARLQLDVLAENALYARRIYEKVCEIVLYDYNNGAGGGNEYGSMYLYAQGIKEVAVGEARMAVWDEEGRISRLVADVEVVFQD
jgi:hypothetical protein